MAFEIGDATRGVRGREGSQLIRAEPQSRFQLSWPDVGAAVVVGRTCPRAGPSIQQEGPVGIAAAYGYCPTAAPALLPAGKEAGRVNGPEVRRDDVGRDGTRIGRHR
jgi:hypothetical protein